LALSLAFVGIRPALAQSRPVKTRVDAIYPELAKRMKIQGTVRLSVVVTPTGTVRSTKVLGGHPLLAEASVDAVKRWHYTPASEETTETVVFNFN
jgi:protein TonB